MIPCLSYLFSPHGSMSALVYLYLPSHRSHSSKPWRPHHPPAFSLHDHTTAVCFVPVPHSHPLLPGCLSHTHSISCLFLSPHTSFATFSFLPPAISLSAASSYC